MYQSLRLRPYLVAILLALASWLPLDAQCYPRATASGGVTITVSDSATGQLVATRATAHTARTTADSLALLTGRTYIVRDQSAIRVSRVGACTLGRVDTVRLRDTLRIVDTVRIEQPGPVTPPPPPPVVPPSPPPAPTSPNYPNEPAGVTVIRESSLSSLGDGWVVAWNPSSEGLVLSTANDATAPISPPGVLNFQVPVGAEAGGGPILETTFSGTNRLYWAFWFKLSSTFPTKNMLHKLAYVEPNNVILVVSKWTGDPGENTAAGGHYLRIFSGGQYPLANGTPTPLTRDAWHRAELVLDRSGSGGSHVLRWWVDGVLQGSYANQSYSASFARAKFTPQQSGSGGSNPTAYWVRFDHTRLSRW